MNRDDLIGQLASCVGQGMRVPDEAFRLAASIDLERFNGMSVHSAALLVLRMGLQKRFRFLPCAHPRLSVRPANGLVRPVKQTANSQPSLHSAFPRSFSAAQALEFQALSDAGRPRSASSV
jgi:hypothetical protein